MGAPIQSTNQSREQTKPKPHARTQAVHSFVQLIAAALDGQRAYLPETGYESASSPEATSLTLWNPIPRVSKMLGCFNEHLATTQGRHPHKQPHNV